MQDNKLFKKEPISNGEFWDDILDNSKDFIEKEPTEEDYKKNILNESITEKKIIKNTKIENIKIPIKENIKTKEITLPKISNIGKNKVHPKKK